MRRHIWHAHPGVRSEKHELSLGERAADRMRNSMGSWAFVFAALLFLGSWMFLNRGKAFDPYPFILLNLVLSCLAALQGAILLIAAKRSDQVAAELAMHHYDETSQHQDLLRQMQDLLQRNTALTEQVVALTGHGGGPWSDPDTAPAAPTSEQKQPCTPSTGTPASTAATVVPASQTT